MCGRSKSSLRFAKIVLSAIAVVAIVLTTGPTLAAGADSQLLQPSSTLQEVKISRLDLLVIFGYLIGIVLLGSWAGMRRKKTGIADYFLASRSLTWPLIGTALFATNISTIHLVSFAQNGYTSGLTYGNYEWMAAFTLVILSLFFAPFYLRSNVATLPDFMEKRYSRACRDYLAILSIFSAIVVHIGFSLLTGAIVLEGTILHIFVEHPEQYRFWSILAICGATAIYTIIGGLLAVVVTEAIQTVVLLLGSICITLIGFWMIGGWDGLAQHVHPMNLTIVRPSTDPTGVTWYAVFLGYPVLGVWYWCTDQTIVQRVLGAKDEYHARMGPLFAGFIKILPVYLFVLPGIICLGLVHAGKIPPLPVLPDGSPNTEETYPHLIKTVLWPGMRGVVVAAMLAALMSTVSGALNSIATLFSYDIYRRWITTEDERHLVRVGRIATFVAMCVAVVWSLSLSSQKTVIFQAMVDVFPVVAPPTAVTFLWGVFWRRTSARAAFLILVGGSLVGVVVFILTKLEWMTINSLFMAFILFVAESVIIVLLSLAFPHQHTEESQRLVWRSPWEALRRGEHGGRLDFRLVAAALVITMVGLYWWFSSPVPYHPIRGELLVDGKPAPGVLVLLDSDDDRFDAALLTDLEGRFEYGSKRQAGGAPPGMVFRVGIKPARQYWVEELPGSEGTQDRVQIIGWMAASAEPGLEGETKPGNDTAGTVGQAGSVASLEGSESVASLERKEGVEKMRDHGHEIGGNSRPLEKGSNRVLRLIKPPDFPSRFYFPETSGLTIQAGDRPTTVRLEIPSA